MDWFRVYSSILDKPNLCGLDAEVLGYWLLFLAYANRSLPRGTLPTDIEELAWAIHKDSATVARMIDVLVEAGLLIHDGDRVWFHKWSLFQAPSTDRSRESRARKTTRQRSATNATNATNAAPGNIVQRDATNATQREEREEREEKEREKVSLRSTTPPLPPPGGVVVVGVVEWARALFLDSSKTPPSDRDDAGSFYEKIPGLCARYDSEWVKDAILQASLKPDLEPRRIGQYVNGCLRAWKANGGPAIADAGAGRPVAGSAAPSARDIRRRVRSEAMTRAVAELPE